MLDLVDAETKRIESTFLEPACGDGNFWLKLLQENYLLWREAKNRIIKKINLHMKKAMLVAVGSIYGVDIMQDNTKECVERLYKIVTDEYERLFKTSYSHDVERCVRFILSRNIVCGNTLDMTDFDGLPIRFSSWKNPSNGWINRKEYAFEDLLNNGNNALPLSDTQVPYCLQKGDL